MQSIPAHENATAHEKKTVRICLVGDVMLGRGVDQMLPYQVDPVLYEANVTDARFYLDLILRASGPLPENRPVDYVWGDAKAILAETKPDLKIINLETSITSSGSPWPGKMYCLRMHPGNVEVIKSAGIDCCSLANNHVMDWGYAGLSETLNTLQSAGIKTCGAGFDQNGAESPAILNIPGTTGRVLVFAAVSPSAFLPRGWAARGSKPGVHYFDDDQPALELPRLAWLIQRHKKPGDLVIMSLHWGGNFGFDLGEAHQEFARALIDNAQVDIVYGHSAHHIKGVEVYKGKLIAYGCADFITDFEGMSLEGLGSELKEFRHDLSFMYIVDIRMEDGHLEGLTLYPMCDKHIQMRRVSEDIDRRWLFDTMKRECRRFGADIATSNNGDGSFRLVLPD